MNELLREIQQDIRRERTEKLWHSFGRIMVAASVIIVLVTIGIVVSQNYSESRAKKHTSQLIQGLDRMQLEDYKGAIEIFDAIIKEGTAPYDGIAALRKADAQIRLGDKEGAVATRKALAGKKPGRDRTFTDLAKLTVLAIEPEPSRDSPFYYTQIEWKAWALMEEGNKEEAAELFASLRDDELAPTSLRDRARAAAASITPESKTGTPANE